MAAKFENYLTTCWFLKKQIRQLTAASGEGVRGSQLVALCLQSSESSQPTPDILDLRKQQIRGHIKRMQLVGFSSSCYTIMSHIFQEGVLQAEQNEEGRPVFKLAPQPQRPSPAEVDIAGNSTRPGSLLFEGKRTSIDRTLRDGIDPKGLTTRHKRRRITEVDESDISSNESMSPQHPQRAMVSPDVTPQPLGQLPAVFRRQSGPSNVPLQSVERDDTASREETIEVNTEAKVEKVWTRSEFQSAH